MEILKIFSQNNWEKIDSIMSSFFIFSEKMENQKVLVAARETSLLTGDRVIIV